MRCWISLGPYTVTATIHLHPGLEPRIALSRLDRTFITLTDAAVSSQAQSREYQTLVVNRRHIDMLALLTDEN